MTRTDGAADVDELVEELATERRYLAAARDALRRMRERAQHTLDVGAGVGGDAYAAERLGATLTQRIVQLSDLPDAPLFFGRLDMAQAVEEDLTRYYVGRRHVTDEASHPLVLDWRAPACRAFYRASTREPLGVEVRRRFGSVGGTLTSFEDEHLDRAEDPAPSSRILTEEIERPRVGPMRDIVATIQPEQDELVRADLAVSLCVQGGPGTGKTAVGLHRAAYLFYTHRQRLERSGVLVVGPNRALLQYVSSVLPALGELDAEQVSIAELYPVDVRCVDAPAAASLKHDARMADVLHRALWSGVVPASEPVTAQHGSYRCTLPTSTLDDLVDEVRRTSPTYSAGRDRLRARVADRLRRQVESRQAESPIESLFRTTSRSRSVTRFLDATWPPVTPERLLHRLLSDPGTLARSADGILTAAEQETLLRAPARTHRTARWSEADRYLLDEISGLVARPRGYSHVVVDEAQDLSPMQCRALARRSTHGSLTVLGDLAQGTTPWAARSWRTTLTHLGRPDAAVVPLTTGFRVPSVVMEYANRLVPALGLDVPVASSLRHDGSLRVQHVDDLVGAGVDACRTALAGEGSVGLVVPDSLAAAAADALDRAGLPWGRADDAVGDRRLTLVPATVVKGLEFDAVVALEPARVVAEEARGVNRLYVVLTRAVSDLVVLHREPLPRELVAT